MSTREHILRSIRSITIDETPLPDLPDHRGRIPEPLLQRFEQEVTAAGGDLAEVDNRNSLFERLRALAGQAPVWSTVDGLSLPGNLAGSETDTDRLHKLELTIAEASFGVAENGAVWLSDTSIGRRVAPFIARHLVLLLDRNTLLENMHLAYQRLGTTEYDYGCFVCGPSKTADIEQSLVMGAHGPEQYTLLLL